MMNTLAEFKTELKDLPVVELRAQMKDAGIAGYSKMRKAELVDLLASERILRQAAEDRARRAVKAPAVDQNELCRDCDHPMAKHYADVACDNGGGGTGCPCRGFKSRDEDPLLTPDFDEEAVYAQAAPAAPKVEIHTGGELHPVPKMPVPDFVFNLSRLLDDPLRKPDANLVKRDGTDPRMEDFVFCTEGALDLYADMVRLITHQLDRGKDVVVLVLCRGGKHRSVAYGENLAAEFDAFPAKHHHIDLPIVKYAKAEATK